jgi:hypothetical protein
VKNMLIGEIEEVEGGVYYILIAGICFLLKV